MPDSRRVSGPLLLGGSMPQGYGASLSNISKSESIHFVGVGGIGMSALATILHERGFSVHGCDVRSSAGGRKLQNKGIPVFIGHDPSHLTSDVGLVVFSSAVLSDEAELVEARKRKIPIISRGQLLADMACQDNFIGVAGAHGKTTTSGMAAQLLIQAGWDPTVVVGGYVHSLGSNARSGSGRYMVAETDESDGSFLLLKPEIGIVTNIDREHLNHYKTFDNLVLAFQQFTSQINPNGVLIRCEDDQIIRQSISHRNQISYGFSLHSEVSATSISPFGWGIEFSARYKGQPLGKFRLKVPGRHNVSNALAVISLSLVLDIPIEVVREALWEFRGTWRRFQLISLPNDIWFVDDYAHHPSEIQATLTADPFIGRHRLVVFQPHRFSRTKLLEEEFSRCFEKADGLIVTDIYSAFEAPIPGVSGERVASLIKEKGHPCVRYIPRKELSEYLSHALQPQDTVFFLGAGDISELCHDLASQLRS